MPVIKILMAENLKVIIDGYIMNSKPNEEIPDSIFHLFDLANHVSDTSCFVPKKLETTIVDMKRIVKIDKVVDILRDLPISDSKFYQDSMSYKLYFKNKYGIRATKIAICRI